MLTQLRAFAQLNGRLGLAAFLAGLVIILVPFPASAGPPADRHFRIEATSFAFSPSVISVNSGMPAWGPIFSEAQSWTYADFLWTFQFDYGAHP